MFNPSLAILRIRAVALRRSTSARFTLAASSTNFWSALALVFEFEVDALLDG
jgi:hypothetical protein